MLQSQLIQRLQSLSASHDLLVAEDWTGASLEELIRAVLQPFIGNSSEALDMPRAARVRQRDGGAEPRPRAARARHQRRQVRRPVDVGRPRARHVGDSSPTTAARCVWCFAGRNAAARKFEPPAIKGFGHVVIERVAGQALNANVTYEFPPEGVRWSIAMPLEFVVRWRSTAAEAAPAAG